MSDTELFVYSGLTLIVVGIGNFIVGKLYQRWRTRRIQNGYHLQGTIIDKNTVLRRYMVYLVQIEYEWQGVTRQWHMQLNRKKWLELDVGDSLIISLPADIPNKIYPVEFKPYNGKILVSNILGWIFLIMGILFAVLGWLFHKGLIS